MIRIMSIVLMRKLMAMVTVAMVADCPPAFCQAGGPPGSGTAPPQTINGVTFAAAPAGVKQNGLYTVTWSGSMSMDQVSVWVSAFANVMDQNGKQYAGTVTITPPAAGQSATYSVTVTGVPAGAYSSTAGFKFTVNGNPGQVSAVLGGLTLP